MADNLSRGLQLKGGSNGYLLGPAPYSGTRTFDPSTVDGWRGYTTSDVILSPNDRLGSVGSFSAWGTGTKTVQFEVGNAPSAIISAPAMQGNRI